jgi:hypothetical protein
MGMGAHAEPERRTGAAVGADRSVDRAARDANRHESEAERIDRNLGELLEELPGAIIGAQVLFGFLLALPFMNHFEILDDWQRGLYLAVLLLSAAAIVLFCGPVAFHRAAFRRHQKARVLQASHRMTTLGLAAIAAALTGAVTLVVSVVLDTVAAVVMVSALTGAAFVVVWGVLPLLARSDDPPSDPDADYPSRYPSRPA